MPFKEQTEMTYVRDFNGESKILYLNGMIDNIQTNWERHEAEGLLGEAKHRIHQIVIDEINKYLRKNLLIA